MAKIYGLHTITLQPRVRTDEFERFFVEQLAPAIPFPGWRGRLLKGDRGERAGQYLILWEIDSVATRDRYYPAPDTPSEEAQRLIAAEPFASLWPKLVSMLAQSWGSLFTDYVEVTHESA
jgi:hypothetical protein